MVWALTPLALKPAPVTVTPEMVTLEFPLLVSVTGNPLLPPTFTLPKLRLVGLAPSRNVAATPVPLRAIVRGEPGALLVMETLPLALPAAEGANCALNVAFRSEERRVGKEGRYRWSPYHYKKNDRISYIAVSWIV